MSSASALIVGVFWVSVAWCVASSKAGRTRQGAAFLASALAVPLLASGSGWLADFESFPPPLFPFFGYMIAFSAYLAFSKHGTEIVKQVPLWALVGFQSFRLLAEWTIVLGVNEGRAPIQLSLHGYNYDIVTAVSAIVVAAVLKKRPVLWLATAWNLMGMAFLAVIAFIAMTSMPTPLRLFMNEPSNIWVTGTPYVLLPAVLVVAALTGHLMTLRKIRALRTR